MKREQQQTLRFREWGGRRAGAGRPRKRDPGVSHDVRPRFAARYPVQVSLRAVAGAPNLRRAAPFAAFEATLRALLGRASFRVVHFTVLSTHLHLLVEADGREALSRGLQALAIRIARGVNRAAHRTGKLWRGRYHARILRSPREARTALCYVLQNARRHASSEDVWVEPGWVDPRSSGPWFDGWREPPRDPRPPQPAPVSPPRTWLLASGWRRHGLVGLDEVPPAAFA